MTSPAGGSGVMISPTSSTDARIPEGTHDAGPPPAAPPTTTTVGTSSTSRKEALDRLAAAMQSRCVVARPPATTEDQLRRVMRAERRFSAPLLGWPDTAILGQPPSSPSPVPLPTHAHQHQTPVTTNHHHALPTNNNTSPLLLAPVPVTPFGLSRAGSLDRDAAIASGLFLGSNLGLGQPARGWVTNGGEVALLQRQASRDARAGGGYVGAQARQRGISTASSASGGSADEDLHSRLSRPSSLSRPNSVLGGSSSSSGGNSGSAGTDRPRYQWPLLSPGHSLGFPGEVSLAALQSDDFNVFDYSEDQLVHCSLLVLVDLQLVGEFGFRLPKLQNFLVAVRHHYHSNAYHNYYHGFGVMHFAYWMLRTTDAGLFLNKLDQLSLMLASLCHDIDHPGTTNGFQIASDSDIARAHNDTSCLEQHHLNVMFELLRDPDLNVLTPEETPPPPPAPSPAVDSSSSGASSPLGTFIPSSSSSMSVVNPNFNPHANTAATKWTVVSFRSFRRSVISAILATDMVKHFDLVRRLDALDPQCESLSPAKEEDRQFLIDLLTHCADLSGQVLPYNMAVEWEARLTQEFIWQADMEAKLGLPVSSFMQGLSDHTVRFKAHLNFVDFVLSPLYMGMAELFPPLQVCVKRLLVNRKAFMQRIPLDPSPPLPPLPAPEPEPVPPPQPLSEPPTPLSAPVATGESSLATTPGKPAVWRSVTMPHRSLRVGLLRQQRAHSPPPTDSMSLPLAHRSPFSLLAGEEERSLSAAWVSAPMSSPSPAPGLSSPIIPMCTHRDASNAKDVGFCLQCATEQCMPLHVVDMFHQSAGLAQPDLSQPASPAPHSGHRRKSSAPLSLSPIKPNGPSHHHLHLQAHHSRHVHTVSSPNAVVAPPPILGHNRHSSHSSDSDHQPLSPGDGPIIRSPPSEANTSQLLGISPLMRSSAYVGPQRSRGSSHLQVHGISVSGTSTPTYGGDSSPQLIAVSHMEHRRHVSQLAKERKAARWKQLIQAATDEPIKALPLGSSASAAAAAVAPAPTSSYFMVGGSVAGTRPPIAINIPRAQATLDPLGVGFAVPRDPDSRGAREVSPLPATSSPGTHERSTRSVSANAAVVLLAANAQQPSSASPRPP